MASPRSCTPCSPSAPTFSPKSPTAFTCRRTWASAWAGTTSRSSSGRTGRCWPTPRRARVSTLRSGVFSYRVDVREKGQPDWGSLVRIRNKAELTLAGQSVSPAKTAARNRRAGFPVKINAGPSTRLLAAQLLHPVVWPVAGAARRPRRRSWMRPAPSPIPARYSDGNIKAHPDQKGGLYEPLLPENVELEVRQRIRVPRPAGRSFRRRAARRRRRTQ